MLQPIKSELAQVAEETCGIEIKTEDTEVKPEKEDAETEHVAAMQLENQEPTRIKTEQKPPFKIELAEEVNPHTSDIKPVLEEIKDFQINSSSGSSDEKVINAKQKVSKCTIMISQKLTLNNSDSIMLIL